MKLQPQIVNIEPCMLIGISDEMSLIHNTTPLLWRRFRTELAATHAADSTAFYSLQQYPPDYFNNFNPAATFVKHALIENNQPNPYPTNWSVFHLQGGVYAVFNHRGGDTGIFQEIYTQWLPQSGYALDNRPHFEKLPANYIPGHPDSEEDIYIPVRPV
jgi:AraC family transcriptional regulator